MFKFNLRAGAGAGAVVCVITGVNIYPKQRQITECADNTNSAFVFIKPHANTSATQTLVKNTFKSKGIKVVTEGELTAQQIDRGMLIDQHYYAIASKATLLKPRELPVPAAKFQEAFGISWESALSQGIVYNALDACAFLGISADELESAWQKSKLVKFGGGFYCGLVSVPGKAPIYVFNGFFMAMRSKFVTPGTSIHYYVVEFEPDNLSWADFRGKVLGPTDPSKAPVGSLRGTIMSDWKKLNLTAAPNVGDNGVHASASPFEGLAERMNWLGAKIERDPFGARLIAAGVPPSVIKAWSVDPQVKGKSLFDQLEDTDSAECIAKSVELAK